MAAGPFELVTSATVPPVERELLERITAIRAGDAWVPILVVAPTGRILTSLRRRILGLGRTVWAVHLLHHRALAERIVESAGAQPVSVLRGRQQKDLLAELLSRISPRDRNLLERSAAASGGTLAAVLASFRDLREALVPPGTLEVEPGALSLARLYRAWCAELDRLEATGLGDAVSLARQAGALAGSAPFIARAAAVLHFGAYDLTGANRALIERIAARAPVTLFVPGVGIGPAFAHSRATLSSWIGADAVTAALADRAGQAERAESGPFAPRLRFLYDDESVPPEPIASPSLRAVAPALVEVVSAPGAEAELEAAARRALAFIVRSETMGGPVAPHEIAIVSRTIEPYAAMLEPVLRRDHGLPFSTSAKVPVRRDPRARALRDLLCALLEDFPATALFDFLRSGEAGLASFGIAEDRFNPDRWALLARRAGIAGGREGWTADLTDWAEARLEEARREEEAGGADDGAEDDPDDGGGARRPSVEAAARAVEDARDCATAVESLALDAARWARCSSWSEHAGWLRTLISRRLAATSAGQARIAAATALDSAMASLDEKAILDRSRPGRVTREDAAQPLMQAIDSEVFAMTSSLAPGVAVLDAMQLRGSSFRVVIWIGLNSGQQPLRPRPDPCLPDEARRALRLATGAPLPLREEAGAEERLLVAIMLGAAREQLVLSWQHADDAGRSRAPSIVMRELARALCGRADIEALASRSSAAASGAPAGVVPARAVPMHPKLRAEAEARGGTGLVAYRDAAVAIASREGDPARSLEAIGAAVALVRAAAPAIEAVLPDAMRQAPGPEVIAHALALGEFASSDRELLLDGEVGASAVPTVEVWSPSGLEMMGRCPLRWFFRAGLRVDAPGDIEADWLLDPRDAGEAAHRVLNLALGEFLAGDGAPLADPEIGGPRLEERIAVLFDSEAGRLAKRAGRRYPRLWKSLRARWIASLARTIREELQSLIDGGLKVAGRELPVQGTLNPVPPGGGAAQPLPVRGRVDRLDVAKDGRRVVVDYKSSANPEKFLGRNGALRGDQVQLHLYRRLVAPDSTGPPVARVVPIGSRAQAAAARGDGSLAWPPPGQDIQAARFDPEFDRTLGQLAGLQRAGRFPMHPDGHCEWCEFLGACRKSHPPSETRVSEAAGYEDYFALEEKTFKS